VAAAYAAATERVRTEQNPILADQGTIDLRAVYEEVVGPLPQGRFDAMALRSLNDWVVKLLLMPVGGVTDVLSFGGEVRQFQVQVDPQRLLAYGLGIDEVTAAVEANNRNATEDHARISSQSVTGKLREAESAHA